MFSKLLSDVYSEKGLKENISNQRLFQPQRLYF